MKKREMQSLYTDEYLRAYDLLTTISPPYQELRDAHIKFILDNTSAGDWILDFGAGTGNVTCELLKHNRCVMAIDVNSHMIKWLKNKCSIFDKKSYKIKRGDLLKMHLSSNMFSGITAMNVLYQIEEGYHEKYCREFVRICRKGASVAFSGPHKGISAQQLRELIFKDISEENKSKYAKEIKIITDSQKVLVENPKHSLISDQELVHLMKKVGFTRIAKDDTFYNGLNYFITAHKK